jgi:integrase
VQYDIGGKSRRVTLGTPRLLTLGAARAQAREMLARVRLGGDPAATRRAGRAAARETFGALLPRYLAVKQAECRAGTSQQLEHRLAGLARPLHPRPVSTIDRRTIAAVLSAIGERSGPSAAVNTHSSLSGYFAWLVGEGLLDENPMVGVNRPTASDPRDRVLTDDELRVLWAALDADDYSDIIKLLILTGCRRGEIGDLTWDEVDLDRAVIEIPAARMKNHRAHVVPLSAPALDLLRRRPRGGRDHVFGSGAAGFRNWSRARRDLGERLGDQRPDWVLHDLRRLVSTALHEKLGVAPHIVERVLAHVGHQSGVAGTYNKSEYIDERRRALTRWADLVAEIVTGKKITAAIVQLRPGA